MEEKKPEEKPVEEIKTEEKVAEVKPTEEKPIEAKKEVEEPHKESETHPESSLELQPKESLLDKDEANIQSADNDEVVLHDNSETEKKESIKTRYMLLEKLLSLLNTKNELNPVLAGYFSKVVLAILEKRKQDFLEYVFKFDMHINNVVRHSYNKSIADILNKIITNEERSMTGNGPEEFQDDKKKILDKMIDKMGPANSSEDITNNCYILCTLVDTKQLLSYFMSESALKRVFDIARSPNQMSLRAALTFFIILYRLKTNPPPASEPNNFLGFASAERKL